MLEEVGSEKEPSQWYRCHPCCVAQGLLGPLSGAETHHEVAVVTSFKHHESIPAIQFNSNSFTYRMFADIFTTSSSSSYSSLTPVTVKQLEQFKTWLVAPKPRNQYGGEKGSIRATTQGSVPCTYTLLYCLDNTEEKVRCIEGKP